MPPWIHRLLGGGKSHIVCLYAFNDTKGADYPKRQYWDEHRIKSKNYGYMYDSSGFLNARCSGTDATASDKRFQYLTTQHAKLLRILRVLPA